MMHSEPLVECRRCREVKPLSEMCRDHGKATQPCRACKAAAERERLAAVRRAPTQLDPCPACGVAQAEHWRCANCTSRGHQMGRGRVLTDLCGWCEAELLKACRKGAA